MHEMLERKVHKKPHTALRTISGSEQTVLTFVVCLYLAFDRMIGLVLVRSLGAPGFDHSN